MRALGEYAVLLVIGNEGGCRRWRWSRLGRVTSQCSTVRTRGGMEIIIGGNASEALRLDC